MKEKIKTIFGWHNESADRSLCPSCFLKTENLDKRDYKQIEEDNLREDIYTCNGCGKEIDIGMGWFNFYFSWRIYLGLFFSVLLFFQSLGNTVSLIENLIDVGLIATLLIAFKKKKAWLYNYNVFLLAIEGTTLFLRGLTPPDKETGTMIFSIMIYTLAGFLWFFLNYRYFKKRKAFMFYSESS